MAELIETPTPGTAGSPSAVDIHDRVADAYYGKMGARFMRETQDRIHWICAQVVGDAVLDVGCSQGITSILLGREGKRVLAIDSDDRSVNEAKTLLANEHERVQGKVEFRHTDFLTVPSHENRYDTVIISEVLEHLVNPSAFVDAAAQCLKPGGTLVVTVPFGINDFIDHKQTYYLLEPFQLLNAHFEVTEISMLGKWLGLSGQLRARGKTVNASARTLTNELVERLEKAFHSLENELRRESGDFRSRLQEANLKYRSITEQAATYKQRLTQEELTRRNAQNDLNAIKLQQDQLSSAALAWKQQNSELSATVQSLQAQRRDIELAMVKAQAERESLAVHLHSQEARFKEEQQARLDALVRTTQLDERHQSLARHVETLLAEQAVLAGRAGAEREEQQGRLAQLQARLQQSISEREAVEHQLDALRNELTLTRDRLHEAVSQHALTHELVETLRSSAKDMADLLVQASTREFEAERQVLIDRNAAQQEQLTAERDAVQAQLSELQVLQQRSATQARVREQELANLLAEANQALLAERRNSGLVDSQVQAARDAHERLSQDLGDSLEQRRSLQVHMAEAREHGDRLQGELTLQQEAQRQLSSERDTERALRRNLDHQTEQMKLQLLQAHRTREELRRQLERAQQEKLAAEDCVARTRAMASFRLGYTLLHGFGSVSSVMKLPGQLWQLHLEGQRRRGQQQSRSIPRGTGSTSGSRAPATLLAGPHALTSSLELAQRPLGQALKGLKVACIMDEFTFSSYAPECNLLPLSVDHWHQELEAFVPELLFIESAWRGKDDRWGGKVGHLSSEVTDILAWCRARQIPTVFWNKEDPIHFETFLTTARLFDHVFTTDIDCIHRYKGALGHDRVYLLPFACQPAASNPIEKYTRKDAFCFAGAYYVRYPERTRDLGNFMVNLAEFRPVEIYDRNFGKNDPNYQFPADYQSFIVGTLPFDQIDKAYKGYRYAINLNSIKQSQTMFARRVFELLASNTITISNYSRGVRLLFGDLVVTTDSGQEIVRRLHKLCSDPANERRFRLAGLRKVMRDHTYQDRLAYVVGKVRGARVDSRDGLLPTVTMTGYAKNQQQLDALMASFHRQTHTERRLLVVTPNDFVPTAAPHDTRVQVLPASEVEGSMLGDLAPTSPWVAGVVPDDYHGPNYLLDLALATRFSPAPVIGKSTHHVWSAQDGTSLVDPGAQYRPAARLQARCALMSSAEGADVSLRDWVTSLYIRQLELPDMLAVDEFNYCKNGAQAADAPAVVNDMTELDEGLDMADLMARAEAIEAEEATADIDPMISGAELAAYFKPPQNKPYHLAVAGTGWEVSSQLGDGKHEYVYAATDLAPKALGAAQHIRFHLDCTPGLNLQLTVLFLDAHKQRISHVVKHANRNQEAPVPAGTAWVRLGLRLYGSGEARVNGLVLGHRPMRPATVVGRADHLLLTNHYPSYDDLYRNGFVHSRVTAYRESGVGVDVFRLRKDEDMSYHEYQNVDVMTGSQDSLHKLLSTGNYKSVLVHFLDPDMWEVLKGHIDRLKMVVWVHGAEIQPWHRRDFNNETDEERTAAKAQSELRMAFWRTLLVQPPKNLHLTFVSRYLAEQVMEDLDLLLPIHSYSIIPNPIDIELFDYQPKPADQRRRVLSIRPFTSRTYANDLTVKAILKLSEKPVFNQMEFRIIGNGKLFDSTLEPLKDFENVILEKKFLDRQEIAQLHKQYGVFLSPSRMDTQGVSRDEAMASGLVPVSNGVAAIPEFVPPGTGKLASSESGDELAQFLEDLQNNPLDFQQISRSAAQHIRNTRGHPEIIGREIETFSTLAITSNSSS